MTLLPLFGIIRYMRKEIDNNNKREVDMKTTDIKDLDRIEEELEGDI